MAKTKAPLFKGLTRPATMFGVPLVPLFFVCALYILFVIAIKNLFYLVVLVPIVLVMQLVTKYDVQAFNLIFLKIRFWITSCRSHQVKKIQIYKLGATRTIFKGLALSPVGYMRTNKKTSIQNIGGAIDYSVHIPYSSNLTESIVITAEGDYLATWEVQGIPFETTGDSDLDSNNAQLHGLILSLGASGKNIAFYQHRTRSDFDLEYQQEFNNDLARQINNAYLKSLAQKTFKQQRLFFTVVYRPYTKMQNATMGAKERKEERQTHIESFNEIISKVGSFLQPYYPEALVLKEDENGNAYSQAISFYNFLLTGTYQKVLAGDQPYYQLIGNKRFFFVKNTVEIQDSSTDQSTFARCIEFKEYAGETYQSMLDSLIYLNTNFVVTQSFSIIGKTDALKAIKVQINRLQSSRDDSISQLEQLEQAKDDLMSGNCCFGMHHASCMVYGKTADEVRQMTNDAQKAFDNAGFITTLADIALPSAFFAQLPANFDYRPRLSMISSINYANMIDMHAFALGRAEHNAWGQSLTVFPTPSKQAYHLNLHEYASENDFGGKVLGHTLVIGYSGAGKTAVVNFLIDQAQKFAHSSTFPKDKKQRFTTVYFDKDYGAKGNILALGGNYISIKNGQPTGCNPFMMENTAANRKMLFLLFKRIACQNVKIFTDRHIDELNRAIQSVMKMPLELRSFGVTRLLEFLPRGGTPEEVDHSLYSRLSQWSRDKEFGWVFDNEMDSFSLDDSIDNFGIDGTEFLENEEVRGALTFYLLHRVMQLIDGRRLIIVFDEFWKWLSDPVFEEFVKDTLKTFRKLEVFLICATQSPSDCLASGISAAIIEQCATQIYLANPKAERSEYVETGADKRNFGLTDKEYQLIKGFALHERKALVKKSTGSSLIQMDLSGLGKYMKLLSTGINDSIAIDELMQKHGNDWIKHYLGENDNAH